MPFADNHGIRIHYQAYGAGPVVVLQHGFASDLRSWQFYGYVEQLAVDYRVICIDARGHGHSDKPHHAEAYALRHRAADVTAVLDQEGIDRAHYCGYSMGGWIGFGLALHAPQRIATLAVGGVHPLPEDSWQAFIGIDGSDPAAFILALETVVGERFPREARARTVDNDLIALAASVQQRWPPEGVLERLTMPCLFYCGERDIRLPRVRECVAKVPTARLAIIPRANHVSTFTRGELVLAELRAHLAQNPLNGTVA